MSDAILKILQPFVQPYGPQGARPQKPPKEVDLICQSILRKIFREIKISIPGNPYQRFYQLHFKCAATPLDTSTLLGQFLRHKQVMHPPHPSPFIFPSLKKSAQSAQDYRENLFFEYRDRAVSLLRVLPIEKEFYEQIVQRFYEKHITLENFVGELIVLLTFLENDKDYLEREQADWNGQPHPSPRLFFLIKALEQNDWLIIPALIQSGLNPNQLLEDPYEESYFDRIFVPLLHIALEKNHVLASAALIQAGADVNLESRYEKTSVSSLEIAAKHGNPELLLLLVQQGADVKRFGQRALEVLRKKEENILSQTLSRLHSSSFRFLASLQKCREILE